MGDSALHDRIPIADAAPEATSSPVARQHVVRAHHNHSLPER
jgi:hypothetical protein